MNQQLIALAASIQQQIEQLTSNPFSELDKDILLEDLRQLYRMIREVEPNIQHTEKKSSFEQISPQAQLSPIHSSKENRSDETHENQEDKKSIEFSIGIEQDTSPSVENSVPIEKIISDILREQHSPTPPTNVVSQTPSSDQSSVKEMARNALEIEDSLLNNKENLRESKEDPIRMGVNPAPSLNEVFSKQEISINERAVSAPVKELHQLIAEKSSVSSLLDFNSRILLTRELFNGNSESCHIFLKELEKCKNLDAAKSLVNTTALRKGWKSDNEAVKILVSLVRKVYT
jgi:hypothetical protein